MLFSFIASQTSSQEESDIHIKLLLDSIPDVGKHFQIAGKLGEGTFSKVYRARSHDNAREYALKYLVPTVKPSRIATELRYMRDVGGKCNVVELLGCFYNAGHTVIIMPILPHERFTDYVSDLTLEEIKDYMKNLLIALERVHSYHIIHRDIKPANFLYDRKSRKYMLVDFGLAQSEKEIYRLAKMYISEKNEQDKQMQAQQNGNSNTNLNVMINPFRLTSNSRDALKERTFDSLNNTLLKSESKGWQIRKRTINEANLSESKKVPKRLCTESRNQTTPSVFNSPITPSVFTTPTKVPPAKKEKLSAVTEESPMSMIPETPPKEYQKNNASVETPNAHGYPLKIEETPKIKKTKKIHTKDKKQSPKSKQEENDQKCDCFGKDQICKSCKTRPESLAPRAGTPGFRAPEVLMKHMLQTTQIDVWSAGVIFACLLSGRYPFFRNIDDLTSLAEIITVMGTKRVEKAAADLNKGLICSMHKEPLDLKEYCFRLRKNQLDIPDSAFDLLDKLLEPSPKSRITASNALLHSFFT